MPNWVDNIVTIKGKKEDIVKVLSDAKKYENGTIRFSSWIPVPETFKKYDTTNYPNGEGLEIGERVGYEKDSPIVTQELIEEYKAATKLQMEQYGVVGWYDYNCKTYGCKWDCPVEIMSRSEDALTLSCETPWSAPNIFFLTMSERYPNLLFHTISSDIEYREESLFEKGVATLLMSKVYSYGEIIEESDKMEGKCWLRRKWHRLMYEARQMLYRFRIKLMRIMIELGIIEDGDDDLPF